MPGPSPTVASTAAPDSSAYWCNRSSTASCTDWPGAGTSGSPLISAMPSSETYTLKRFMAGFLVRQVRWSRRVGQFVGVGVGVGVTPGVAPEGGAAMPWYLANWARMART